MLADVLAHHGVKGMKWGVRKDAGHEGEQAKTKKIAKLDSKFEKNTRRIGLTMDIHNYAARRMAGELDRINGKKEYDTDLTKNPALMAKYEREVQATYVKHLRAGAEKLGTNASGTKKYVIDTHPDGDWHVSTADVGHEDATYKVSIKKSPKGHVLSVGDANVMDADENPDELKQSEGVDLSDFLAHHGVLGMKWGHRKGSSSESSKSSSSSHVSTDYAKAEAHKQTVKEHGTKALSNKELQDLVTRMNLEQQHRNLINNNAKPTKFESGQKRIDAILKVGRTLNDLNNLAKSPVGKAVRGGIKAGKAANAAKKIVEEVAE